MSPTIQHNHIKHVEVDHHFIKDHLKYSNICTLYVKTEDQLAAILIKGLTGSRFSWIVSKLDM